ncbi:DUF4249 domain-containing protein [Lacinutrix mariniflava]|uniref:DUF4249 domain-containing protein n=1 Tax=Lacinutrix mariniflava TaxID=342955 RepID=UPI0006E21CEF|nr:DUF4249 domain-containing protein [Lacinutrix mariniflava]
MKKNSYIFILIFSFLALSCREEIELETDTFESVLVVEATVTNELKHHEIKISRTSVLEETEQIIENNADVIIVDNAGNSFNFSQNTEGVYISDNLFEALPNVEYTLEINTTNGATYSSNQQTLTPISQIDNLYAEFVDDDVKGPGVQIFVDSENNNPNTQYFRYEFEETYKIKAPYDFPTGFYFTGFFDYNDQCDRCYYDINFFEKPIEIEEEICYTTNLNTEIIQANTITLTENNILRLPVRFIPLDESNNIIDTSILRDRYSIKVKQYVQNLEAYNYYKLIYNLSNTESVLSQTQSGFAEGNISAIGNNNISVVGFFEVASVAEERIFFNYQDVNIPYPNYIYACDKQDLDFNDTVNTQCDGDLNERRQLYNLVSREQYQLVDLGNLLAPNVYTIAKEECVNCTTIGTNIQPDFWID